MNLPKIVIHLIADLIIGLFAYKQPYLPDHVVFHKNSELDF